MESEPTGTLLSQVLGFRLSYVRPDPVNLKPTPAVCSFANAPLDAAAAHAHHSPPWTVTPFVTNGDRVTAGTAVWLVLVAPNPRQRARLEVRAHVLDVVVTDRNDANRLRPWHSGEKCHDVRAFHQNGQPVSRPASSSGIARSVASLRPPNSCRLGEPAAYAVVP